MFLHLSVILFREGGSLSGGLCPGGSLFRGVSVQGGFCVREFCVHGGLRPGGLCVRGVSVQEGSLSRRGLCPGGVSVQEGSLSMGSLSRWGSVQVGFCVQGVPVRESPTDIQLLAGGTHPTVMHSCLVNFSR